MVRAFSSPKSSERGIFEMHMFIWSSDLSVSPKNERASMMCCGCGMLPRQLLRTRTQINGRDVLGKVIIDVEVMIEFTFFIISPTQN